MAVHNHPEETWHELHKKCSGQRAISGMDIRRYKELTLRCQLKSSSGIHVLGVYQEY